MLMNSTKNKTCAFLYFLFFITQSATGSSIDLGEFEDHKHDSPVTTKAAMRAPESDTRSSEVIYGQTGEQQHKGYLSQPENKKVKSGLIVIHEWWGLNEDIHLMADQLAGLGYHSLAVDLYDGKSANGVREAFQLSTGLSKNEDAALANLKEAYDY